VNCSDQWAPFRRVLGSSLREYRQRAGLSQIEMAETLGLAPSTLSNYESGKSEPPLTLILLFCHELRIPFSAVVPGDVMRTLAVA
jgi:transcriptional regulator with XRE-family HTH domain